MKKVDDKNKPKDDKDKGKDVKKPLLDKKGKPIIEPEPEEIIPPPIKESMFYYKIIFYHYFYNYFRNFGKICLRHYI